MVNEKEVQKKVMVYLLLGLVLGLGLGYYVFGVMGDLVEDSGTGDQATITTQLEDATVTATIVDSSQGGS